MMSAAETAPASGFKVTKAQGWAKNGMGPYAAHEGFPGHHLQLAIARHHPDPLRSVLLDPVQNEGWALYAEEALWNHSPFGNAPGFDLDDECIAAMLENKFFLSPTVTHPRNLIDFTQPHDPAAQKGRVEVTERRYRLGCANLKKAKAAGVPFLPGTDSGFAITPYGEWHARELELFVDDLGFTPAEALRATTEAAGRFMTNGDDIGLLEPGRFADFIALDGSPLADIGILQDKRRLRAVYTAGKEYRMADRPYDPRKVTDFALTNWTDLYTQARVAELGARPRRLAAE